jgi:hypothetical protein
MRGSSSTIRVYTWFARPMAPFTHPKTGDVSVGRVAARNCAQYGLKNAKRLPAARSSGFRMTIFVRRLLCD